MKRLVLSILSLSLLLPVIARAEKPNILIITVDDMSADSLGCFGSKLAGTSPTIDAFAKRSLKFNRAHVHVGNCMPGRNIMWSGLFSHINGVEGFRPNPKPDYPVLCDLAKEAGYFTAIRGKVSHSTPYHPYAWDAVLDADADGKKRHTKDAKSYGDSMRDAIALSAKANKPFCTMINISDPHKPFYAQGKGGDTVDDPHVPSKVFSGADVPVPGFLPDDEVIRKELAHYYSSVSRADDCFREVMTAVDQAKVSDNLFIMFLSDHGMPLPFAKTQLYHHSTHTPLMVSWSGVTQPGSVDNHHMVGAVDFIPTLLDVMEHKHPTPRKLQGRSFTPILRGQQQADRDYVVLQYNENSGRNRQPMRGIQTREFLYLYNPWSDGKRKFATATTGTQTYRQMVKRAASETAVAARLKLFDYRVLEELFDVKNDPDCLVNLIDSTKHRSELLHLRELLTKELAVLNDPVAPLIASVKDDSIRNAYMAVEDERTQNARKNKKPKNPGTPPKSQLRKGALKIEAPKSIAIGKTNTIVIKHNVPKRLGKQKLHVTLKKSSSNQQSERVHREVVTIEGQGETKIEFNVPDKAIAKSFRVAAFIGEDFESNLIHVNSDEIAISK